MAVVGVDTKGSHKGLQCLSLLTCQKTHRHEVCLCLCPDILPQTLQIVIAAAEAINNESCVVCC